MTAQGFLHKWGDDVDCTYFNFLHTLERLLLLQGECASIWTYQSINDMIEKCNIKQNRSYLIGKGIR